MGADWLEDHLVLRTGVAVGAELLPNSPPVESIVKGKLPHRRELATGVMGRQFGARWVENPLASLGRKGGEA